MAKTPEISVVIPAYQARPFIVRAVTSALKQTIADIEVIVASDDLTDYLSFLRANGISDHRVRCVLTDGYGTGPARARNTGLDAANGRVVVTLDADDQLAPNALEALVPLAIEHGAAYSRPRFVDNATNSDLESLDRRLPSGLVGLEDILTSQIHTYAGIAFDRTRIAARWPEWMDRWEDVFFYVSCFDDVDQIYHVSEPLYVYHRVAGSICNRPETGEEYLWWADHLAKRIENGDGLGLRNNESVRIFHRFLKSRHLIEAAFIEALAQGSCKDFHSFTKSRLDLFYALEADLEISDS